MSCRLHLKWLFLSSIWTYNIFLLNSKHEVESASMQLKFPMKFINEKLTKWKYLFCAHVVGILTVILRLYHDDYG